MICSIDRFAYLPQCDFQVVVTHLSSMDVAAGQIIARQGQKVGRYYYLERGSATLWQSTPRHSQAKAIATLHAGDGFGDRGYFLGGVYEATLAMQTSGRLGFIDIAIFSKIIQPVFAKEIGDVVAKQWIDGGYAQWLDCRLAVETEEGYLQGAQFLPLDGLSEHMSMLEKNTPYVVYCYSGRRSLYATYLLRTNGFMAWSLRGGILSWPHKLEGSG